MRHRMTTERWIFGGVMLAGLALLAGATWAVVAELSFRAGAHTTQARIVEMRPSSNRPALFRAGALDGT